MVAAPARADLPASRSALIGRDEEVARLRGLLLADQRRLVTLVGPAGVGKTRLAVEAARAVAAEFADGARFVPLAAVTDPALVAAAVAEALDVRPGGDAPAVLATALRDVEALLLLDNLEQVAAGAATTVAALLQAPGVAVLATSRTPLRLPGETVVPVEPLPVPSPDAATPVLADSPAVRLFLERARAVDPLLAPSPAVLAAVGGVVRRLDGLPLAIELAAARSGLLSPTGLLERLGRRLPALAAAGVDIPERHRTLRSALAWSHDLLDPDERRLFRRLAPFAGGFGLDGLQAVAGDGEEGADAAGGATAVVAGGEGLAGGDDDWALLDRLAALVDDSLVRRIDRGDGPPRFLLLETVREYAGERLAEAGEAREVYGRHADWALGLAEAAWGAQWTEAEAAAYGRLETEHDNLRAALAWALAADPPLARRLAGALWWFWWSRGHIGEGHEWCRRALALPGGADEPWRPRFLAGAAFFATDRDERGRELELSEAALAAAEAAGDAEAIGLALIVRAFAVGAYDRLAEAEALAERAVAVLDAANVTRLLPLALTNLAVLRWFHDRPAALRAMEQAVHGYRVVGWRFGLAGGLVNLAGSRLLLGQAEAAAEPLREALAVIRDGPRSVVGAEVVALLAALAAARGRFERAARLLGGMTAYARRLGAQPHHPASELIEPTAEAARRALGDVRAERARRAGAALDDAALLAEAEAEALDDDGALEAARALAALSPREREVLRLLAAGRSDKEIGDALFISPRTVQSHAARLYAKLGVTNRTEAAALALRHGLA